MLSSVSVYVCRVIHTYIKFHLLVDYTNEFLSPSQNFPKLIGSEFIMFFTFFCIILEAGANSVLSMHC